MIILASGSPRRKELISLLNIPFEIHTKEVEEKVDQTRSASENVQALAKLKAEAVAETYETQWVIGADTVVCLEGKIMGKPKDEEDAKQTLRKLSGKTHQVCTGVAIIHKAQKVCYQFCETTQVTMKNLTEAEIDAYVASQEPMDKAGSYGIQGKGALYISGISGDYYNVVGLPVHQLYEAFLKLNIKA